MRFLIHAAAAAALFAGVSAHAVEVDYPPDNVTSAQVTGTQRAESVALDEELKEKRRKAREEELARAKARFMQQVRSGATAEPGPAPAR